MWILADAVYLHWKVGEKTRNDLVFKVCFQIYYVLLLF